MLRNLFPAALALTFAVYSPCATMRAHAADKADKPADKAAKPATPDKADKADKADKKKVPESGDRVEGSLHAIDLTKKTITLRTGGKDPKTGQKNAEDKTFDIAADAQIGISDGTKTGGKKGTLADLKEGMRTVVLLSPDKKSAVNIQAAVKLNLEQGAVKAADAAANTLTLSTKSKDGPLDKQFVLAKDTRIVFAGHGIGTVKGQSNEKAGTVAEIKPGMSVSLQLSEDSKSVVLVRVAAPVAQGELKAVDTAKNKITITRGAKDKQTEDKTYDVAAKVVITVDGKESKLSDLKEGTAINLQISPDDGSVVGIRVGEKTKVK